MRRWAAAALLLAALPLASTRAEERPTFDSLWRHANAAADHQTRDDGEAISVAVPSENAIYYFTKPGEEIHPGVIERHFIQSGTGTSVELSAWSFGPDSAQPAFKRWVDRFAAQTREVAESMRAGVGKAATDRLQISPTIAKETNVTRDSRVGWIPAVDQREAAIATLRKFLVMLDDRRYVDAYGLLEESNRRRHTLDQFIQTERRFGTAAGPALAWTVLKITWTKDPPQPFPGVFVAIDLAGRYANADRHCGFVVLYQPAEGAAFGIIRVEDNFMTNTTARDIEQKKSKAEVARLWAEEAGHCPNYVIPPALQ